MVETEKLVLSLITTSLKCVSDANVPAELREIAFSKIFDFLAAGTANSEPPLQRSRLAGNPDAEGGDALERIASRMGLSRDAAERVYFPEGDRLDLVVSPSRLDSAKSRATEQIALLVAAGRQAAGLDDGGWTAVDPIREACENFKRYDSSNFATTIKDMGDLLTVRGSGRDRKVRMTAPAWDQAREMVINMAGS